MAFTYILFSETLQKYYVGSTSLHPDDRLMRHLAKHKGFTARAGDWKIVHVENFESLSLARQRESQIKKWKSQKRIKDLINRTSTE